MLRYLLFVVYALLQTAAAGTPAADTSPLPAPVYTVSRSFPLAGNGGWDYLALEASGARLFVSRSDHVDVVETVSGKLAGTLANTAGVHGIASRTHHRVSRRLCILSRIERLRGVGPLHRSARNGA